MNPTDKAPDWIDHTCADRIHMCRFMLVMHGFLSAGESEKVKRRQVKRGFVPPDAIIVDANRKGDR